MISTEKRNDIHMKEHEEGNAQKIKSIKFI
jgi:hypothetical protein